LFVYRATAGLTWQTGDVHYQLQLRRAVASIAANIAEGRGQYTAAQFTRFLSIAIASAQEAESHVDEMQELGILPIDAARHIRSEIQQVRAMTITLRRHLRSAPRPSKTTGER